MAGGGVQSNNVQTGAGGNTSLASALGMSMAPAQPAAASGWTQNSVGNWVNQDGQMLPGGINPGDAAPAQPPVQPPVQPPQPPVQPPTQPPVQPPTDPWSSIPTQTNPWGSGASGVEQAPNQNSSFNRGATQGQSLTDFLNGFSSTYVRSHNYGDFTAPTQPPTQPPNVVPGTSHPITGLPDPQRKPPTAPPSPIGGGNPAGGGGTNNSGGGSNTGGPKNPVDTTGKNWVVSPNAVSSVLKPAGSGPTYPVGSPAYLFYKDNPGRMLPSGFGWDASGNPIGTP